MRAVEFGIEAAGCEHRVSHWHPAPESVSARVPAPARRDSTPGRGRHRGEAVALVSHTLLPSMKKALAGVRKTTPEAVVSCAVLQKTKTCTVLSACHVVFERVTSD